MDIVERYCEGEEAGTLIKEARDEIARLRDELTAARKTNSEWLAANGPGGWINDLRDENEALASNLRGKHATTGATYAHLIAERDSLRDENARLRADQDECDALRGKMADILTRTATALRGEPKPLHLHSWHDLPERVTAVMNALAGAMELASAHVMHDSDCATHNEPAYPNGPCDCSAAMQAKPTPEDPRVMARFDDGRPMMTYHRAAMQKGE